MKVHKKFDSKYSDINSPEFAILIVKLNGILVPYFKKTFANFLKIVFIRFFQGSVGMDFELVFQPTSNVTNTNIIQALEDGNGTEGLGFLSITGGVSVTEQLPFQMTTAPSAATGMMLLLVLILEFCFNDTPLGSESAFWATHCLLLYIIFPLPDIVIRTAMQL